MDKTIENLSNETIETIKNRSAYKLPNNPSERGFKTEDIKGAFWRAEFDGEMSIMGQLKKLINRLNEILPQTLDNTQIVDDCVTADDSKVASANQLVVLKGLIDTLQTSSSQGISELTSLYEKLSTSSNTNSSNIYDIYTRINASDNDIAGIHNDIVQINTSIDNLSQASCLLSKDENGVLRVGDAIVSSKKALVSNPTEISTGGTVIYQGDSILGRTFEIEYGLLNGNYPKKFYKFKLSSSGMDFAEIQVIDLYGEFIDEGPVGIGIIGSTITNKLQVRALSDVDPNKMCVYSLKEIFE
jgi:hypothetical protein